MKKIKVLIIDHMGLLKSEMKKYDKLSNYSDLELCVLTPAKWRFNYKTYYFEGRTNGKYRIINSRVAFPGFPHRSFYFNSMKKILKTYQPNIIHLFQEPYSFFAAQTVLARNLYSPSSQILFISWENIYYEKYPFSFSKIYNTIEQYTYRNSICATPITESAKKVLQKRGYKGRCEVMNWGVDLELFKKQDVNELKSDLDLTDKYIIGYIGRFIQEKGIFDLLKAVAKLGQDIKLLLIGSGPFKEEINALIKKLEIEKKVMIVDTVPNNEIALYTNCLNLLVLPTLETTSCKEQLGRVLIEAMACEVPVIGSNVGEIPNVINNKNLVFRSGDYLDLKTKIESVKEGHLDSKKVIKAGKERVTKIYSWEKISAKLHKLYSELMLTERRN